MVAFIELLVDPTALMEPRAEVFFGVLPFRILVYSIVYLGDGDVWNVVARENLSQLLNLIEWFCFANNIDAISIGTPSKIPSLHCLDRISSLFLLSFYQAILNEVGI